MIWNAICDRCGSKRLNEHLRIQWDGLRVCRDGCWEPRNAQDGVKGVPDRQAPPWVRPEPTDTFENTALRLLETGALRLLETSPSTPVGFVGVAARALESDDL